MSKKQHTVVLVDGSSYLYRAFYGLPPLTNASGQPTGAVFGVMKMLKKLITDYSPDYMAVVFDPKGPTFRNELYSEYKAHRPPMPDDLRIQIEPLHELIQAVGLPLIQIDGVEADDVLGTLAVHAKQGGYEAVISTGDKDIAQLVNDHITLVNTMNNTVLDEEGVEAKFGVKPDQIIDYLALMGDTSDNIPGVPKVGPKTAAKWLAQYGSLDGIIEHADEIKGKVGENLRASLEQLPLSKQLTTIKCDVELPFDFTDLKIKSPDTDKVKTWYSKLDFKNPDDWIEDESIENSAEAKPAAKTDIQYDTVLDINKLKEWISKLKQADYFAFDTETTSLSYLDAELVGVSFSVKPGEAAYVPVAHDYAGAPEQIDRNDCLELFKPLLESEKYKKLGQNLKYDAHVLANYGIELNGIEFDTMLESYVLDSTKRHDMDSLAKAHLDQETIHFEDIAGKGAKQLTFNQIHLEQAAPYAAEDADITLQLHHVLYTQLKKNSSLLKLFNEIELPLIRVLNRIERNGVNVDRGLLAKQSKEITSRMQELEKDAFAEAGHEFNLGSPKQLQEILFDKLGLPVLQKTPKGQPSTAESVLSELALDYSLPKIILEHRSLSKLKSTYTDKLPDQINAKTGRVHTSYHQAVTATGRLSSSDPNLQNIPVRTAEGRRIRQAFVAPKGYQIVAADYSQIELRIMAHLSADEGLLTAFSHGEDIHRATAAEVFGLALEDVNNEQRRSAKAINFGLIYGMSAFGLAKQLGITRGAAQEYVNLYFERYPGVKKFMDDTREKAREQGYVETVYGRRLYLPEIKSRNAARRQYAERTAINAPMQGTAADIIKMAMITVDDWLQKKKLDCKMIMQVHDELVFEVKQSDLDKLAKALPKLMTDVADLKVPLVVDVGQGDNWDEAH